MIMVALWSWLDSVTEASESVKKNFEMCILDAALE